jgi:hypothetical protein
MPLMCDIIAHADVPIEIVRRAQQTFMFSVNVEAPIKARAVDWLLAEQCSRGVDIFSLPPEIQESEFSYPGNNVDRQGRRLTPDFIRTVNVALQIVRYFKPNHRGFDILELGGGLGHLARTMKLLGHAGSHVIMDLPETLVFSFCFLSLSFPQARMLLVEDEESARAIAAGGFDFAFVPALFADAVCERKYDLFLNTASLGEMPNKTIRYWMDFVQNSIDVRYIYTLNRYLNTIDPTLHSWRWEENECSLHYDGRWDILQWELEPRFTRCPYVDTLIARYVEIAAARLKSIDESACAAHAAELLRMVQDEDWYSVKRDSAIMTRGDRILAHDLSTDGTLFKLWNVLRLHPTADAVETLLRYLDTLLAREDRVFEEQRYYEDLLFELFVPEQNPLLQEFITCVKARRKRQAQRYPQLLDSNGSFNFIQAGDEVIAVSKTVGPVNLLNESLGERNLPPVLFIAGSLEEARARVSGLQSLGPGVIEVYNGFNIIWGGQKFCGVRQGLGQINLSQVTGTLLEREYEGNVVFGESVEIVRAKIRMLSESPQLLAGTNSPVRDKLESLARHDFGIALESKDKPRLLQENYRGFNIVAFEGKVWAVAIAAGPIDLQDTGARERLINERQLLQVMTVEGACMAVDRLQDRLGISSDFIRRIRRLVRTGWKFACGGENNGH